MIKISLTDFVDFVISSGTPKLTKVRQLKRRGEYRPAFDYWKNLRDEIIEFHKRNMNDKNRLDEVLESVVDEKKIERYKECLRGYKRFIGKKKYKWFDPPYKTWGPKGLTIRINPELGLRLAREKYIIKLYFKAEALSQRKIEIIFILLYEVFRRSVEKDMNYCILDVQRSKLFSKKRPQRTVLPLLRGEAANFLTIWKQV